MFEICQLSAIILQSLKTIQARAMELERKRGDIIKNINHLRGNDYGLTFFLIDFMALIINSCFAELVLDYMLQYSCLFLFNSKNVQVWNSYVYIG